MNKNKIRCNTPEERLKSWHVPSEHIELIKKQYKLDNIFKKHKIPTEKQEKICRLLWICLVERNIEINNIARKAHFRPIERIRLQKLYDDVEKLLSTTPYIKDEEKEECKNIIKFAVTIGEGDQGRLEKFKKITQKRTVGKIKKSEKNLWIYTLLIKNLIPILNPVFRDKVKDKWLSQTRKKEKTFSLAAEIINKTFPAIKFTPQQIKGRFHKV